ncbi:hypothetical protein [Methylovorus sp. MP688]|uniref:hypothetical protein n=1 Tax=Methylovorus sp. (strain MP688) TaxID=887061 RepID=UPI001EE671E1|nr:hypothetical protein [Methylovorus sp. MP688]
MMMVDALTDAAIQQLNLGYNAEEDRLLLKIGLADDVEVPVWLTRRIVRSLWKLLHRDAAPAATAPELAATPIYPTAAAQVMQAFAEEMRELTLAQQVSESLDMTGAYEERSQQLGDEPLLVSVCRMITEQPDKPTLELAAADGQTLHFSLSPELGMALGSMLQLATREAQWDLGFADGPLLIDQHVVPAVLH